MSTDLQEVRKIAWRTIAEFLGVTEPTDVLTGATSLKYLAGDATWKTAATGTVISVSVTPNAGVSAVVANPTTTPALTFTLGAITPTSVAATSDISAGSIGNVKQISGGMVATIWRIRERVSVNDCAWTTNIDANGVVDDNTKSSWEVKQGAGTDTFLVARAPAGSSSFSNFLTISNAGLVTVSNSFTVNGTTTLAGSLPVGAIGNVQEISVGMTNTLARFRERVGTNDFAWTTNISAGGTQDDAAKSSWQIKVGSNADTFTVSRSPAGSSSLAALLTITNAGVGTITGNFTTNGSLQTGAIGTVQQLTGGMTNTAWRIRERVATNDCAWTTNIDASGTQDDASKSSWQTKQGSNADTWSVARASAGSSTFVTNLLVDSSGRSGFGVTPSAVVSIKAGTAAAGTAANKIADGTRLTTAEVGVHEVESNHYLTNWKLLRFSIGGPIFDHFADVSNVTTGETDLYTDTLIANTFAINGDKVSGQYAGTFTGAVSSTQQLRAYFGGTLIFDSGALSIGVATDSWDLKIICVRESSSIVRCSATLTTNFATLSSYATYTKVTGLTLSGTNILKVTGQAGGLNAASNQITASLGSVEYRPAVN